MNNNEFGYEDRITVSKMEFVKKEQNASEKKEEQNKKKYTTLAELLKKENLNSEIQDEIENNIVNNNVHYLDDTLILSIVLGYAIGDALGVPAEFKRREELSANPIVDMIGNGSHNQPEGTWSDDTSMVLATMDSIAELQTIDYKDIMCRYLKWYKQAEYTASNQVFDIGMGTRRALEKFARGTKAVQCGEKNFMNNGNGALMRMFPIALYTYNAKYEYRKEVEAAYYFSSLTHGHDISMMACKIYSDYIKALLNGESPIEALNTISNYPYDSFYDNCYTFDRILSGKIAKMSVNEIKSTGYVVDTLEASIWCLIHSNSYEEAVLKAVNLGEDTDTIAAITGSLAGIVYRLENIPIKWIHKLKNKALILEITKKYAEIIKKNNNHQQETVIGDTEVSHTSNFKL